MAIKHEAKYQLRRRVTGAVLATTIALGAAGYKEVTDAPQQPSAEQVRALKSLYSTLGDKVVLKAGVFLHSTPEMLEGEPGDATPNPGKNNVIEQTSHELIISDPLQTADGTWIAFSMPGAKQPKSLKQRAAQTVYADLPALVSEGYAQVIGDQGGSASLPAYVAQNGQVMVSNRPSYEAMIAQQPSTTEVMSSNNANG